MLEVLASAERPAPNDAVTPPPDPWELLTLQGLRKSPKRSLGSADSPAVEELNGIRAFRDAEERGGVGSIVDGCEDNEGAGLVLVVGHGVVGCARDEAKSALRTHHQMFDDFQRVVKVHESIDAVAGGALDAEFFCDERRTPSTMCLCVDWKLAQLAESAVSKMVPS